MQWVSTASALGTIFSRTLNGIEKVDILEEKFGIRENEIAEGDV